MTKQFLQITCIAAILLLLGYQTTHAQSITILPGESTALNYTKVFTGSGYDAGTVCTYNKAKGMLTIGIEFQKDGLATWPDNRIAIKYNGQWYQIFEIWTGNPAAFTSYSTWDVNRFVTSGTYNNLLGDATKIKMTEGHTPDGNVSIYLKNLGVLRRYDGNYLPQSGDITNRSTPSDYSNFSLQTAAYSSVYNYPVRDPDISSGIQALSEGYLHTHADQTIGNLPGVGTFQESPGRGIVYINLVNLPPDMLESSGFRVHLYQNSNTANDRIYEWVYNSQNFMFSAPMNLSATQNVCGKVTLNWGNATNTLPTDGAMDVKTVIFRNGNYLATVDDAVTTYDDVTAAQDVDYQYSLRHVAFTESGKSYYRSPVTASVVGKVKPSPDQPISPTATTNTCNGDVTVSWQYPGANPQNFRIDRATSSGGPFTSLSSTIAGSARSYAQTGLTRGQQYYYRIYALNSCNVLSVTYAECNGISIADPVIPTGVTAVLNATSDTIRVSWLDAANNETKYQVQRQDDAGNLVTYDVNPQSGSGTTMVYKDAGITSCRSYTYSIKVFNDCVQSGLISTSAHINNISPPNLNTTFTSTKKLICSKGYFSNRVELSWQNNNGQNIDVFKIYRKINASSTPNIDSVLIGTAAAGSGFYVDNTADARVYYKYTIVGFKYCNGTDIPSNTSEDIGFRNPTGNVTGQIMYNGNISVLGAKVLIQQPGGTTGNSISLSSGATVSMTSPSTLGLGNALRVEFWFKPTSYAASQNIVEKTGVFSFKHTGSNYVALVNVAGSNYSITVPETNFTLNNWKHVSMQYNGTTSSFKLYGDGVVIGNTTVPNGTVSNVSNQVVIGGTNSTFLMDEFRVLAANDPDSNIYIDFSRFLNGNKTGMKILCHFDEAYGTAAYDGSSQNNIYNANHFQFAGGVSWTSDKPSPGQLGYYGITDTSGNYNVSGITYSGTGEIFTVVPTYQTHSFSPNTRSLFIGDASTVFSNQDFTDISSFTVQGYVYYSHPAGYPSLDIGVPDVTVKVDGLSVVSNGQPVVTDANGKYTIQVPIGQHHISVEKFAHHMEAGLFPPDSSQYNFQADMAGLIFRDSTKRTIVGRVAGGSIEANKAPGMGRSINNLGQAKVMLRYPSTGTALYKPSVTTDSTTGEFWFNVIPLEYKVDLVYLLNDSINLNSGGPSSDFSNTTSPIDLRNLVATTQVKDSVFNSSGTWSGQVDSVSYHARRDFIYRIAPDVNVTDTLGRVFIGEDSLSLGNSTFSIRPTGPGWGPFTWPVFKQDKTYKAVIHGSEIYTNADNGTIDTVLLDGNVRITNDLISGADPTPLVPMSNGRALYTFTCGEPNNAAFASDHTLDYTWDMQVVIEPSGAAATTWKPNASVNASYPNYHAIVMGQKITGTGVSTQGPEAVDFILRDPPGSGSSATWSSGSTVTIGANYSAGFSEEHQSNLNIYLGQKAMTGAIAYYTEVEVENTQSIGFQSSYSKSTSNGYTESFSSSTSVSTRDDADNVGAAADIFVGRSRNWLVGPTNNIELRDVAQCVPGATCFGPVVNGKRLAKTIGYAIAPDGVRTRFAYTANEIETVVIPQLESIRNAFFVNQPTKYISHILPANPLYGSNNDDPLWGTDTSSRTPLIFDKRDTTGHSYTIHGVLTYEHDSIRIINTQIRLWKEALAKNEKEKISCVNNLPGYTLQDNFTLGSAILTNAYSVDATTSETTTMELSLGGNVASVFAGIFGGIGVGGELSLSLNKTTGSEESHEITTTNSFEYTLTDGDPGDIMSIDVYKSNAGVGHIFVTRGGQTMCPYEDAVLLHYYNPANPGAYISSHSYNANGFGTIANATVQREEPNISITPNNQFNIPSNQPAIYQLSLTNQSALTVNNDIPLRVYVASESNPYGAIVKIDGLSPNTSYTIPTGASVIKTLTVERGPIEINYDSLMIIFASECSDDIADTAYVSAHFIPTCTDIVLQGPTDNWIFNNSGNNIGNVVASGYNYNYGAAVDTVPDPDVMLGFNKIGLEFKPSNSSSWTEFKSYYKYPVVGQDTIPNNQVYVQELWDISTIVDGAYELKAKSYCLNKDGSLSTVESPVAGGVVDRINPSPFGTPTPGDGILDPNDDISIQFNEPIDIGSLSASNFDIRGVLNQGTIRHSESLNFDGAGDFAEVGNGVNLQKRNFTFEFWAKLNTTGIDQTIISQGTDALQNMAIGFTAANKLVFEFANQSLTSNSAITLPTDWHHYAFVYDYGAQTLLMYVDGASTPVNSGNTTINFDYMGSGKLYFGKKAPGNTNFFTGNMHEVRLWNKTRTIAEIYPQINVDLGLGTSGLLYNWKMDEAEGTFAGDRIRSKNATINGATWEVSPVGYSMIFDGANDRLDIASGTIPVTKEMDFTLEFWFKSNQAGVATLFSNGDGTGTGADSLFAWNIQKDASGAIHVYHHGLNFVACSTNYFDNNWHHFALVLQRSANISCYIDGNLQNSVQALSFGQMGSANVYLGAQYNAGSSTFSNHYNGMMDEFRFWNTSRKLEQIRRDKRNRMLGDEFGLQAFVPFESYAIVLNVPVLNSSTANYSSNPLATTAQNGPVLSQVTPTIKLPRPIQSVGFNYSVNNDKIIITPTTLPVYTENVTLDVTVKNIYDLHGNQMQSPKTWIAYVNKNQVLWQNTSLAFTKTADSVITFTTNIVNSGGAAKQFTIGGLPSWMTTGTTSGTIAPNSVQAISFTIPAGTTIGSYDADLTLTTDFGYDEILQVSLKVVGVPPNWTYNPQSFQYSMPLIGEVELDGVVATDVQTQVAAFINGNIVGTGYLQYVPAYDKYEVFMSIHSHNPGGDSISFNIYDPTTGLTFVDVTPVVAFDESSIVGTVSAPVTLQASSLISLPITLNAGWTWVSFPLQSNRLQNANSFMSSVTNTNDDVIRSISAYDQYFGSTGWIGNITSSANHYTNAESYKMNRSVADTLNFVGAKIYPDSAIAHVNVVPGWNWIGYASLKNTDITTALSNYPATTGDIIKSQYEFAFYDALNGWIGNLTTMYPGRGYLLKSAGTSTFSYPLSTYFGRMSHSANKYIPSQNETDNYYAFAPEAFAKTMSVIVKSDLCDELSASPNTALGAFDQNNTLRGYATAQYDAGHQQYLYFLTLCSNTDGEVLHLNYFNVADGDLISSNTDVTFMNDGVLGTPAMPVYATVGANETCSLSTVGIAAISTQNNGVVVYPNPFVKDLSLAFGKEATVTVELTDMLGKTVYTKQLKKASIATLNLHSLSIGSGFYTLRITGDVNTNIKVVKTEF
jgi:hypothetical protein